VVGIRKRKSHKMIGLHPDSDAIADRMVGVAREK
jgi:hypothetical protein